MPDTPQTLFDELAEDYESMREELAWDPFVHIRDAFKGSLKGLKILDAGCGTGECCRWFQAFKAVVAVKDLTKCDDLKKAYDDAVFDAALVADKVYEKTAKDEDKVAALEAVMNKCAEGWGFTKESLNNSI